MLAFRLGYGGDTSRTWPAHGAGAVGQVSAVPGACCARCLSRVDGLTCAGTLVGTVRTVASLSGQDLNRRRFLMGSAFAVTGLAQPAPFVLTLPAEADVARRHGRRVGAADVEVLTEQLTHLRRLDHRYGAGRVREQVVGVVNRASNLALHGSYSDATGRALLEAVAHGTWLAGLMASDLGRHALAQRYYTHLNARQPEQALATGRAAITSTAPVIRQAG